MARRLAPLLAALALAGCAGGPATPRPVASPPAPDPQAEALALADAYVRARFARFPEDATRDGWPAADHAAVTDASLATVRAWEAEEDRFLARSRALPPLPPGSPAALARAVLEDDLASQVAHRPCRLELWPVSSPGGWQTEFALLAALQPVGTPELRAAALARLAGLATRVDQEIENLREGARTGFTPARANVERVREELGTLLALEPARWPMTAVADRDPAPGFREALERAVAERIVPAARRYRDALGELLPHARELPGVSGLPGGAACYRGAIRASTTLDLDPGDLHALGLRRLAEVRAEMAAVGARRFGTDDVTALRTRLLTAPEHRFRSADELVGRARAAAERAIAAAPRAFLTLPRGRPDVKPLPDFQAKGGGTARFTPVRTGDRLDGIYWINAWAPETKSRALSETVAFHETWPGHHLQIALAAEGAGKPEIARYVRNGAYVEGWALYAERLADELGLFSSDLDRFGLLQSEAFRATRLVVDTGLHALGWTREQAIAVLLENALRDPVAAAAEVDRYAAWPGQALAYMVGALEIRGLRDRAARRLGPRFDLRGFHEVVLGSGAVPLSTLRDRVERWIDAEEQRGPERPAAAAPARHRPVAAAGTRPPAG